MECSVRVGLARRVVVVVVSVTLVFGAASVGGAYDNLPDTPEIGAAKAAVAGLQYRSSRVAADLADAFDHLRRVDLQRAALEIELWGLAHRLVYLEGVLSDAVRWLAVLDVSEAHYRGILAQRAVDMYVAHSNFEAHIAVELVESTTPVEAARTTRLASRAQVVETGIVGAIVDNRSATQDLRATVTGEHEEATERRALVEVFLEAKRAEWEEVLRRIARLRIQQQRLDIQIAQAAARVRELELAEAQRLYEEELARLGEDADGDGVADQTTPPPPPPQAEPQAPVAAGDAAASVPIDQLVCPVPGATFSNDWGNPRSGWRFHSGTDLFAPAGTPNVAVASGWARQSVSDLGGQGIWLEADHGVHYYYAHLSGWAGDWPGGSRYVSRGETIGFTGNTGNAAGGPTHTHFQIHPGGGAPVNPYSVLLAIC